MGTSQTRRLSRLTAAPDRRLRGYLVPAAIWSVRHDPRAPPPLCESLGVELASEKWGGYPHYRGLVHHLGDDEFGTWVWGPRGRMIYRGDEALFPTETDALTVIVPGAWWAPAWWIGNPELALYVNINTPAERRGDDIVCIDLDLDVIRFTDGRVEIVDRDEFEDHRVRYAYPDDIVAGAEAAAAEVYELVIRNEPPFDGAAASMWIERARAVQWGGYS